jgi:Ca-activated chloride channel homolog
MSPVTFRLLQPGQIGASDPIIATTDSVIPPGNYIMETRLGAVLVTQPLTVDAKTPAKPQVILNAAEVTLAPRVAPGAAIETASDITISGAFGDSITLTQPYKTWLAAGDYTVTARLDAVTATQPLQVAAGLPMQQDIIISAAPVAPLVFYAPGQPVSAADLQVDIVSAATNPDGTRSLVSSRTGAAPIFHLGAGDYVAIARLGLASVEAPFSIALVQRTELPIVLNAGVLAIAATGASDITISTPPDIAGNATALGSVASDTWQETLNAGSYQVTARFGQAIATAPVTITSGGRVDLVLAAP